MFYSPEPQAQMQFCLIGGIGISYQKAESLQPQNIKHIVQSWLTSAGQPGYNEDCDLADDDTINIADLALFAENFLQGL